MMSRALLFAGQGAPTAGMGRSLVEASAGAKERGMRQVIPPDVAGAGRRRLLEPARRTNRDRPVRSFAAAADFTA